MKKKIIIFLLILPSIFVIKYKYISYKCRNINYATENYLTRSSLFNKYRLSTINNSQIKFSDGHTAVIQVEGLSKKSPHTKVSYSLFLEKSPNQVWRIKNIYKNAK